MSSKADGFGLESVNKSGVTGSLAGSLDPKPPSRSKLGSLGRALFEGASLGSDGAEDDRFSRSIGGAGRTGTFGFGAIFSAFFGSLADTAGGFDGRGGGGFDFDVGFVTVEMNEYR